MNKNRTLNVYLGDEKYGNDDRVDWLNKRAVRLKRSLSWVVREAVDHLRKHEKE